MEVEKKLKTKNRKFPFSPKTTNSLEVGDFWTIKIEENVFGCGVVIDLDFSKKKLFLCGLLDYLGNEPPTSDSLSGFKCIQQGVVHIKTLSEWGSLICGQIDKKNNKIEPWLFRGAENPMNSMLYLGLKPLREQTINDHKLPILATWGFNVINLLAKNLAQEVK